MEWEWEKKPERRGLYEATTILGHVLQAGDQWRCGGVPGEIKGAPGRNLEIFDPICRKWRRSAARLSANIWGNLSKKGWSPEAHIPNFGIWRCSCSVWVQDASEEAAVGQRCWWRTTRVEPGCRTLADRFSKFTRLQQGKKPEQCGLYRTTTVLGHALQAGGRCRCRGCSLRDQGSARSECQDFGRVFVAKHVGLVPSG